MLMSFQTNGAADFVFVISGSVGIVDSWTVILSVIEVYGPVSRFHSRALISYSELTTLLPLE